LIVLIIMMLPLLIIWPTSTSLFFLVMLPPLSWRWRRRWSMSMVMMVALSAPTTVFPISMWVLRLRCKRVDSGEFLRNCLLSFNDLLSRSFECLAAVGVPEFSDRLREITMNSPLVYQHIIHASIGFNARLLSFILDKSVLKRIAWFPVTDHFTWDNDSESREDKF